MPFYMVIADGLEQPAWVSAETPKAACEETIVEHELEEDSDNCLIVACEMKPSLNVIVFRWSGDAGGDLHFNKVKVPGYKICRFCNEHVILATAEMIPKNMRCAQCLEDEAEEDDEEEDLQEMADEENGD